MYYSRSNIHPQLKEITINFIDKWTFYWQYLIGQSFTNCTVCISFLLGICYSTLKALPQPKIGRSEPD